MIESGSRVGPKGTIERSVFKIFFLLLCLLFFSEDIGHSGCDWGSYFDYFLWMHGY